MNPELSAKSPAPAGGLVERVARAIHPSVCADPNLYLHEARAAILEVADWLEEGTGKHGRWATPANDLREELQRHG
jgi:hypothetical protein